MLIYMAVVLFISLVWLDGIRKKMYIPVSLDNIAGCMYYLCESRMVKDFNQGMALMGWKERDKLVREMGGVYSYGEMRVASGRRVGVDYHPLASAEAGIQDTIYSGRAGDGSC